MLFIPYRGQKAGSKPDIERRSVHHPFNLIVKGLLHLRVLVADVDAPETCAGVHNFPSVWCVVVHPFGFGE